MKLKMKTIFFKRLGLVALFLTGAMAGAAPSGAPEGQEIAMLTEAPNVPLPITRRHTAKVVVNIEVKEVTKRLADGVDYTFWTFGGSVPGKFMRIRVGDEVEFHLNNAPDS